MASEMSSAQQWCGVMCIDKADGTQSVVEHALMSVRLLLPYDQSVL